MNTQQLIKKNSQGGYSNISPKTKFEGVRDEHTGKSLGEVLNGFNMYFLSYNGNASSTRNKVPSVLRREGLWITYVLYDHTVVTEWYNSNKYDNNSWGDSSNWRQGNNSLVGDLSISSNGNWVINGVETEFKAQGEQGITPMIRQASNGKLQVSYNEGKAWEDISTSLTTFTPHMAANGDLTWTNEAGLPNPPKVNLTGPSSPVDPSKIQVVQQTGQSQTNVLSQKAVQDNYVDKLQIKQELNNESGSENNSMSQKILSNILYDLISSSYKKEVVWYSHKTIGSGETIIGKLNVIKTHKYLIRIKSSDLIATSSTNNILLGLGENGNVNIAHEDISKGFSWIKEATVSSDNSRVYVATDGEVKEGVECVISIVDLTDYNNNSGLYDYVENNKIINKELFTIYGTWKSKNISGDGEDVIKNIKIKKYHTYILTFKSDSNIVSDKTQRILFGVGSNGNIDISKKDTTLGLTWILYANTASDNSRVYVSVAGECIKDVNCNVSIYDLTEPNSNYSKFKTLNDEILNTNVIVKDLVGNTYNIKDFDIFKVNAASIVESDPFNRIRIIKEINTNFSVSCNCPLGRGSGVALYSSKNEALIAGNNFIDSINLGNYSKGLQKKYFKSKGWLSISLCKEDSSDFTEEESLNFINKTEINVVTGFTSIDNTKEFYIGSFSQGLPKGNLTINIEDAVYTAKRCTTSNLIGPPYENVVLSFIMPEYLKCYVSGGRDPYIRTFESDWIKPNQTFRIPDKITQLLITFAYDDNTSIDYTFVNTLLEKGLIKILYEPKDDINDLNVQNTKDLKAILYKYIGTGSENCGYGKKITLAHVTDIHGDAVRYERALNYCSKNNVDAVIATGDYVSYSKDNGCSFLADYQKLYNIPVIACTGNHDSNGFDRDKVNSGMYNLFLKEMSEQLPNYVLPSVLEYEDAPTYYYYDIDKWKIRVIALNVYDINRSIWYKCRISKKQIDWFIKTLANTPSEYGVIVIYHETDGGIKKVVGSEDFYQSVVSEGNPLNHHLSGIEGYPIVDIIDAFNQKSRVTIHYTQLNGDASETITTNADFTRLNDNVEFIAHITGHYHQDLIGHCNHSSTVQLIINSTTTQCYSGDKYIFMANDSDLPRGGKGICLDSFNIITIDRDLKKVQVAKIGSNISSDLSERKRMSISYK